jgi:hypothetical protein
LTFAPPSDRPKGSAAKIDDDEEGIICLTT